MIPSPAHLLRQLRRERAVRLAQDSQDELANRPLYKLDPSGRLNQTLDTDIYTAKAHPALSVVVPSVDVLNEVTRRLDDLHATGSLDHGSFTVMDEFLEAWGVNMIDAATAHTQSQLDYLNRAAIMEARTSQETWDKLQQAQNELRDAESARAAARSALTGTPATARPTSNEPFPAPFTAPAPGTAQRLHTRPPATSLAGQDAGNATQMKANTENESMQEENESQPIEIQPGSSTFVLKDASQAAEEGAA